MTKIFKMSDSTTPEKVDGAAEQQDSNYKPPPAKTINELIHADQEDESLRKYKESLLGSNASGEAVVIKPDDPRRVLVQSLSLVVADRKDLTIDLTGDLSALKKQKFTIQEGCKYRVRIDFYIQREIVSGLKYIQKVSKQSSAGLLSDKNTFMVGSYAPNKEVHSYLTPVEEAPSGMLARGTYNVKSLFTDDDANEHLKWEWSFEIAKEWGS